MTGGVVVVAVVAIVAAVVLGIVTLKLTTRPAAQPPDLMTGRTLQVSYRAGAVIITDPGEGLSGTGDTWAQAADALDRAMLKRIAGRA